MENSNKTLIFETRDCLTMGEINSYLEDVVTEDQRFSIENHLLECDLCNAVINGYSKSKPAESKKVLAEINDILKIEFEKPARESTAVAAAEPQVENIERSQEPAKEIKLDSNRGRLNWAIAAIGITLLGLSLWTYSKRTSQQDLFASYFEPYAKGLIATRSESNETQTVFTQGFESYEKSEFVEAVKLLEKGLALEPENGQANFYLGLAALEGNEIAKAILHLKRTRINHSEFYGSATWYLAMAYLKQGEQELAGETLKGLSEKDAPYFVKSLSLLREIQ